MLPHCYPNKPELEALTELPEHLHSPPTAPTISLLCVNSSAVQVKVVDILDLSQRVLSLLS